MRTPSIPLYVTRKTADGYTGSYNVPAWMTILAMRLLWLNVVAWSLIGLYVAVKTVT
jgi:hypothetical protein